MFKQHLIYGSVPNLNGDIKNTMKQTYIYRKGRNYSR